jgi:hypothetical protein
VLLTRSPFDGTILFDAPYLRPNLFIRPQLFIMSGVPGLMVAFGVGGTSQLRDYAFSYPHPYPLRSFLVYTFPFLYMLKWMMLGECGWDHTLMEGFMIPKTVQTDRKMDDTSLTRLKMIDITLYSLCSLLSIVHYVPCINPTRSCYCNQNQALSSTTNYMPELSRFAIISNLQVQFTSSLPWPPCMH